MNINSKNYFFFASLSSGIIILISSIFLARIYTPEEFGEYYKILFLGAVLATLFSLNIEVLIPYLKNKVFVFSFLVRLSLVLLTISLFIIWLTKNNQLGISILLSSSIILNKASIIYITSEREYKLVGNLKVLMSVIQTGIKFFGKTLMGFNSLYYGDVFQNIFLIRRALKESFLTNISKTKATCFYLKNKIIIIKHLKYGLPQTLIDSFFEFIIPISISIIYDNYTLGVMMFLATKANGVLQIISTNISQYLGTEYIHYDILLQKKVFNRHLFLWALFGLISFLTLFFFGKQLVILIFTVEWEKSFMYLLPFYPYIIIKNLSASFGFIPLLKKLQNKSIYFSIFRTVPSLFLVFFQFKFDFFSPYSFWVVYLGIGSIISFSQIVWYYQILGNE